MRYHITLCIHIYTCVWVRKAEEVRRKNNEAAVVKTVWIICEGSRWRQKKKSSARQRSRGMREYIYIV